MKTPSAKISKSRNALQQYKSDADKIPSRRRNTKPRERAIVTEKKAPVPVAEERHAIPPPLVIATKPKFERSSTMPSCKSPVMRKSIMQYILPKQFVPSSSSLDIQRIIQETKEREDRLKTQLDTLKERVKLVVNTPTTPISISADCEKQLEYVKKRMNSLLNVTQQTMSEIKRTKEMVANIKDENSSKISGSFNKSIIIEDCDEHVFDNEANPVAGSGEEDPASNIFP